MDKYQEENISEISEAKWQLLTASLKNNKELQKVKDIASLIDKLDIDICLFTEIGGRESLENLNQHFLNSHYDIYHHPSNSDRGIDIGILYKKKLAPESFFKFHNHKSFARGVMQYELKYKTGPKFRFLLTHLKSKLGRDNDFEGRSQRKKEVEKLIDIYEKENKKNEMPTFICGDLNSIIAGAETEHELEQFSSKLGLADSLLQLGYDHFDRGSYIYFTKSGDMHLMQLDYALLHPKWKKHIGKKTQIIGFDGEKRVNLPSSRKEKMNMPSDHYPLLLEINLS